MERFPQLLVTSSTVRVERSVRIFTMEALRDQAVPAGSAS